MGVHIQPQQFQVRDDDPFANDTASVVSHKYGYEDARAFWLVGKAR